MAADLCKPAAKNATGDRSRSRNVKSNLQQNNCGSESAILCLALV